MGEGEKLLEIHGEESEGFFYAVEEDEFIGTQGVRAGPAFIVFYLGVFDFYIYNTITVDEYCLVHTF